MKNLKTLILIGIFILATSFCKGLESVEKIKTEHAVPSKNNCAELYVSNLFGSLTIEKYSGKKLQIEAVKTITADGQNEIDKGINEIKLSVYKFDRGLLIYLDHPCARVNYDNLQVNYYCEKYGGLTNEYTFNLDITLKVPENITFIDAGTITGGFVSAKGLKCDLEISNVNGSLEVLGHEGNIEASTVNGDLAIEFTKNPTKYAKFNTVNGEINVNCLRDLSAKVSYETMHGDFYTNYENIKFLPAEVKKTEKKRNKSKTYKLDSNTSLKIGDGKSEFSFKTLNGNMYLKYMN